MLPLPHKKPQVVPEHLTGPQLLDFKESLWQQPQLWILMEPKQGRASPANSSLGQIFGSVTLTKLYQQAPPTRCVKGGEERGGQGQTRLFMLGRAGVLRVAGASHPSHPQPQTLAMPRGCRHPQPQGSIHQMELPIIPGLFELAELSRTPHCLYIIKSENSDGFQVTSWVFLFSFPRLPPTDFSQKFRARLHVVASMLCGSSC